MARNNNKDLKKARQRTGATELQTRQSPAATKRNSESDIERREQFGLASPFGFLRRFGEEMDRLFEDYGLGGSLGPSLAGGLDRLSNIGTGMWSPQIEVFERDNQLVVRADLPGMTK